jgi:spore protease
MQFRTDMADERHDLYRKANNIEDKIDGVDSEYEEKENIKITRVKIFNEKGERVLGKKKGEYISIDLKKITNLEDDEKNKILKTIANELQKLLDKKIKKDEDVLVVGLGNADFVADALGTKVIHNIEVTRHIKKFYPEYLKEDARCISAIAPRSYGKNWNRGF